MRLAQLKKLRMLCSIYMYLQQFCRPHAYTIPKNLVIDTLSDAHGVMLTGQCPQRSNLLCFPH